MSAQSRSEPYDALVVGGGHNGLVCAFYLARAGHRVKVLERRSIVGGAVTTEEFHPNFRNSVCAYSTSILNPKIIDDMSLHSHGLRFQVRPLLTFLPLPDGNYLRLYADTDKMRQEVSRFSQRDADNLPAYYEMLDKQSGASDMWLKPPPNAGAGTWEILKTLWSNRKMASLDIETQRDLADLLVMSVADFLGRWFESDAVKAILGFRGILGRFASPYYPGTADVLLHRAVSSVNGQKGVWGHALGGMGSITQAMARAAESAGVEIEVNAAVAEVLTEDGCVTGVRLEDGRILRARSVAANVNPKLLFLKLVDPEVIAPAFRKRMENYRCISGIFRMNVALKELPDFHCLPGTHVQEHHTGSIVIGPSLDYMDQAFQDARQRGWSRDPVVELVIPSTIDDSLAPESAHVASLYASYFSPDLPDGQSWDDVREQAADAIIDKVTEYAGNFKESVIARQILSPLDLEREFGLIGGDIYHGAFDLNQFYSLRPTLGHADHRMPIKGLYLCGAGAHPGGGVSGVPGHNAAHVMLKDIGGKRFVGSRKQHKRTIDALRHRAGRP